MENIGTRNWFMMESIYQGPFCLNWINFSSYLIWLSYYNMSWYHCAWTPETFKIITIYKNYLVPFILPCCCPSGFYDLETLTTFGLDSDGGQSRSLVRFIFDREYFSSGSNSCNDVATVLLRIPTKSTLFVRIIFSDISFLNLFTNNLQKTYFQKHHQSH